MDCGTMSKACMPKYETGSVNNYSINKCLVELGAPVDEVYYVKTTRFGSTYVYPHKRYTYRANRSIYSRYTKDDLWTWAQYLYKKKAAEIHPDRHKVNKVAWEEYFKYIQQVFAKVKRILKK